MIRQRTVIEGISMWSRWQPDRGVHFNGFHVRAPEAIVVDPLALEEDDLAAVEADGGAAWVVITNRDHERASRAIAQRLGAKIAAPAADLPLAGGPVDRELRDGETIGPARVIALEGMKSPGEIALHLPGRRTTLLGDALWGDPPGSLRMLPDERLIDAKRAALSLRRIWALQPDHLLVGDGTCIFGGATAAIGAYLTSRADVYANRINVDELEWESWNDDPGRYGGSSAEIGLRIGARRLGYHLVRLAPGQIWCPLHWHEFDEELFFVVDGDAVLRTPRGEHAVRRGDFVAFPTSPAGAHQLRNDGDRECTILMVADNADGDDVCHYPDSRKVLISRDRLILRQEPVLDYFDGEPG